MGGASCCAQTKDENNLDTKSLNNKHQYDPNRVPVKGALSKKSKSDGKLS